MESDGVVTQGNYISSVLYNEHESNRIIGCMLHQFEQLWINCIPIFNRYTQQDEAKMWTKQQGIVTNRERFIIFLCWKGQKPTIVLISKRISDSRVYNQSNYQTGAHYLAWDSEGHLKKNSFMELMNKTWLWTLSVYRRWIKVQTHKTEQWWSSKMSLQWKEYGSQSQCTCHGADWQNPFCYQSLIGDEGMIILWDSYSHST